MKTGERRRGLKPRAIAIIVAIAAIIAAAVAADTAAHLRMRAPVNDYGTPIRDSRIAKTGAGEPNAIPAPEGGAGVDARVDVGASGPCRIAHFGQAPWNPNHIHDDEWFAASFQALTMMGLPPDAARQAVEKIKRGQVDDTIGMDNRGGLATASRQTFLPSFTTTFLKDGKRFVCHDSMTVFTDPTDSEDGSLYRIGDYFIVVFRKCGNVSRVYVGPRLEEVPRGDPGISEIPVPVPGPGFVVWNKVPEPSTLWLFFVGAAALLFSRRK